MSPALQAVGAAPKIAFNNIAQVILVVPSDAGTWKGFL
jgi:hypothetical protein